jgi:hypothetical protein
LSTYFINQLREGTLTHAVGEKQTPTAACFFGEHLQGQKTIFLKQEKEFTLPIGPILVPKKIGP